MDYFLEIPMLRIQTMRKTATFAKHLKKEYGCYISMSVNTPFPGTYQYLHAKELGLIVHTKDWNRYRLGNPIVSGKNFTREDVRKIFSENLNSVNSL